LNWLRGTRDWDLAISYYGEDKEKTFPEASFVHRFQGGKWEGIYEFFKSYPDVIERYEYFWLPDDDILTDSATISELFSLVRQNRFELAQPALTADSYFSHLITVQCSCFFVRRSTLVEIMVPVISRSLLIKVLPYLKSAQSGFGLDFIWNRLTTDPATKVAIVDRVAVCHTRPVSGSSALEMGHQSVSRENEMKAFMTRWGVSRPDLVVFGGDLANGLPVRSQTLCALIQFFCWSRKCWRLKWSGWRQGGPFRRLCWVARTCARQIREKPELAVLPPIPVSCDPPETGGAI
jgi:hypothetical protein